MANTELGRGGAGLAGDPAGKLRKVISSLGTAGDDIEALQDAVVALVALANELRTDYAALLAKLDADAGVTDANYASTLGISAPAVTYTP